jgi:hypothetical protein
MNTALYLELVDAVARIDGPAELKLVAERVAGTPMDPLERRVLDRALRARGEAIAIRRQTTTPSVKGDATVDVRPPVARG